MPRHGLHKRAVRDEGGVGFQVLVPGRHFRGSDFLSILRGDQCTLLLRLRLKLASLLLRILDHAEGPLQNVPAVSHAVLLQESFHRWKQLGFPLRRCRLADRSWLLLDRPALSTPLRVGVASPRCGVSTSSSTGRALSASSGRCCATGSGCNRSATGRSHRRGYMQHCRVLNLGTLQRFFQVIALVKDRLTWRSLLSSTCSVQLGGRCPHEE
mmetsp:Transcript_28199/g.52921  ORF Transcript_28199/g.52921 Transcript_28199/m.52921 type:complete len:212 (-) Transcript_28199:744-1379(-)